MQQHVVDAARMEPPVVEGTPVEKIEVPLRDDSADESPNGAGALPTEELPTETLAAGAPNGWMSRCGRCEKGSFYSSLQSARARPLTSATASA